MKSREQLIEEIEEKGRVLYKLLSIKELEELLSEYEKTINRVNYVKNLLSKLDDEEE